MPIFAQAMLLIRVVEVVSICALLFGGGVWVGWLAHREWR